MDLIDVMEKRGKVMIAVLHLPPLPGSPRGDDSGFETIYQGALADALLYRDAGVDAILVENHGDAPFFKEENPPEVRTAAGILLDRIRRECSLPLGLNLLRNDALGALGVVAASGADFIRVNVLTGVVATDQGIVEGRGAELMRRRKALCPRVKVLADVDVKFSSPLYHPPLVAAARSTLQRGLADAVILSGQATGEAVDVQQLENLRHQLPTARILVGSGACMENLESLLSHADGVIVGSALKEGGYVEAPVAPRRLRAFASLFDELRNRCRNP